MHQRFGGQSRTSATAGTLADHKWSALGSAVTLIPGTSLNALADAARVLGSAYTHGDASKRQQYGKLTLTVRGASAFTAGTTVKLWLLPLGADGANYEDGTASVAPARDPDVEFYLRAVATQQFLSEALVLLPPGSWKPLLQNSGGQAFTTNNSENVLYLEPYTEAEV